MKTPDIYSYDDFRRYLGDRYEQLKQADPACTARSFAARAGLSNPGYFNDVVKGKRTLSKAAGKKIAQAFALSANEQFFFELLVGYGQAKKEPDRAELYRKIAFCRSRSRFARLNPALTKYYEDYRYPLIFNALIACVCKGDFAALGAFVVPSIAPATAQKIVEDLLAWGLVVVDQSGRYCVTQRFIEPPPTMREQVRQLNRQWIHHAADALMKLPQSKRSMSTMLLSTTPQTARAIAAKLETFRKEVWDMIEQDPGQPGCIMQLNLQYFPRSSTREEK